MKLFELVKKLSQKRQEYYYHRIKDDLIKEDKNIKNIFYINNKLNR